VIPRVLFFNPWDRLIGPNRYLVDILRHSPGLAERATLVAHQPTDAFSEWAELGGRVEVWPEIAPVHPRLDLANLGHLARIHSAGLVRLGRAVRALGPDVIVSNTENLWIGGLVARLSGVRHLQIFHALTLEYRFGGVRPVVRAYLAALARLADRLVAVSQTVSRMLTGFGVAARRVAVVPNGVDVADLRQRAGRPLDPALSQALEGRRPVLVSVGRIAPMKGQDVLVQAVERLRPRFPRLLCLLVGRVGSAAGVEDTGRYHAELLERIDRHDLGGCVRLVGEIDCVPELLARSDVYVQPSRTESFSRVSVEALVCGRPVVCSDAGALAEVTGGAGVLVTPGDPDALADGIARLLDDSEARERLIRRGQEHVVAHYDIAQVAERFGNLLAEVTS
jgi:glycosyltransferase involved in cell wall biosynthesis